MAGMTHPNWPRRVGLAVPMRGHQGILAGDENGLVASTTNITS
jgi:hypothetical protein